MSDNIDPYLESLRDTRESLEGFVEHANSQFSWMGADIMRIGAETGRLGVEMVRLSEQTIQLGEKIQRSTAESQERYHQVFGRLRLNEKKLEAMLGATDSDRKDLRQVCHDLDRRLTEVEKRLSA